MRNEPQAPAALPDEDTFVLPAAWRPLARPRRGGVVHEVTWPGADDIRQAEELIAEHRDWIDEVLASPEADPTLARAAHAYLAGEADPLGAATVASIVPCPYAGGSWQEPPFARAWTARFGLPFAACAVTRFLELDITFTVRDDVRSLAALRLRGTDAGWLTATDLLADRVRALLAAADDALYEETVAALAAGRVTPRRRLAAAYLAPGTPGWVDDCLADEPDYGHSGQYLRPVLLAALDNPAQVERLGPAPRLIWNAWTPTLVATLADALGTACMPFLPAAVESTRDDRIAAMVAHFPTDEAFRLLHSRPDDKAARAALQQAAPRYPLRTVRLLGEAALRGGKNAPAARQLLSKHVARHHALLPALLERVDPATAELVRSLDGARERVAAAAPEALPELLVSPPWTRPRTVAGPRVLTGLAPDDTPRLLWRDGEREEWARDTYHGWQYPDTTDWASEAEKVIDGGGHSLWYTGRLLVQGSTEALTPWVERWRPSDLWRGLLYLRPVLAKYGDAAVAMAVSAARSQPANLAPLLMPLLSADAARVMADGLVRLKSAQPTARSWFARHGVPGALLLVPDAVGPTGPARRAAEQALRLVATAHGADAVRDAVAERYGGPAADVVAEALAADPLENALPAKLPELPDWIEPVVLPQLLLTAGGSLPEEAVRHVMTVLALSKPGDPYPGLPVVVDTVRADSLAEFTWALFEDWRQAGMPPTESWILHALGPLGNDATVHRLTPILRDWPGQNAHHRAVEGLTVLAEIGTDDALLHLHGIAQRVRFKALKARAQEKIAQVAEGLGLSGEQLADRLVPDLSLDPDGTTSIDYGTRRFTVGFDEQLRPYVLDADGRRRKDLPAPGARDDAELAPAERKRFAALKKDVRTVAADRIRRLEAAMVDGRGWTAEEFRSLFVAHPLVRHLVRRLVWLAELPAGGGNDGDGANGATVTAFRVAEDLSYADVEDDGFTLPGNATVRIAHPLHLGETIGAWSELFADYEILQPFPQLGRPVHRLTGEEAAANRLHRFEDRTVPVGRVLGLTERGWERGTPQDAGVERWISKRLGDGCHLVIALDGGIAVGAVDVYPEQTLETVWLNPYPDDYWYSKDHALRFGDLDEVTASELLADLERLTAE
ncbi:DUF4132 domain-containing protein [Kitasatospora sp. NPDC004240]